MLVAPQGLAPNGGMIGVLPALREMFATQVKGGSIVAVVAEREAKPLGAHQGILVGSVMLESISLGQLVRAWSARHVPSRPVRKFRLYLWSSHHIFQSAHLHLRNQLESVLEQMIKWKGGSGRQGEEEEEAVA